MPAIGSITGNTYLEVEIFTQTRFEKMKTELLHAPGEPQTIVVPVRKTGSPHFRTLSSAPQDIRVGSSETNDTHTRAIRFLLKSLRARPQLQLMTFVFDGDKVEEQTICKVPMRTEENGYKWWTEARIRIDQNRFIQPDICGRSDRDFLPLADEAGIVIEVIQSHYPDEQTFQHLVALSARNYIVIFYFVSKDGWGSAYSSVDPDNGDVVKVRSSFWLANGELFRNAKLIAREGMDDRAWYLHVSTKHFDDVMKKKELKKS